LLSQWKYLQFYDLAHTARQCVIDAAGGIH
jgi:hypothetical protein